MDKLTVETILQIKDKLLEDSSPEYVSYLSKKHNVSEEEILDCLNYEEDVIHNHLNNGDELEVVLDNDNNNNNNGN